VILAATAAGGLIFAAAAGLGVLCAKLICARLEPFADGPPSSPSRPALIVAFMAVVGGCVAVHGCSVSVLAIGAVAAFALTGSWCCDLERGIVPDCFTLVPLGGLVLFAVLRGDWQVIISAAVPCAPFAFAALISRGRGMGWGDVKLVALGGSILGVQSAVFAFSGSCLAAGVMSLGGGRRGAPIAFAPYLVLAAAAALALGGST
jgi:prepilin signal peptidase PulO-like enzyme (type II secretory pathway)